MNYLEGLNLQNLITPAIVIAIIAYFIKFFGKIISDQKPFSDDRGWEIELNGFYFVLNIFFLGAIGVAISTWFRIIINGNFGHIVIFVLICMLGGIPLLANLVMAKKSYKISSKILNRLLDEYFQLNDKDLNKLNIVSSLIITPALFFLITIEFMNLNILWFITIISEIIFIMMLLALNYSLNKYKPTKASIYFTNGNKPLTNVEILKINSDNIRLKKNNKIIILNKNQVSIIKCDLNQ